MKKFSNSGMSELDSGFHKLRLKSPMRLVLPFGRIFINFFASTKLSANLVLGILYITPTLIVSFPFVT